MSRDRLKLFLSHVTFDNKVTRRQRQQVDKLAAIREVWDLFIMNLPRAYVPSKRLTVDEQLYAYRGYTPGRAYMPMKPAKYGIKIFWLCDAANGYALNAFPYSGRGEERQVGLAQWIVEKLVEPYHNTQRNIFMDRYFTTHDLLVSLLSNGLTATGTIMAGRRDVPQRIKTTRGEALFTTKFLWDHTNRIMLASYMPKRNKNVLMMSSFHAKNETSDREDKKPQVILDYNMGKGGVDVMDSRIEDYTCRRKTNRYPLLYFFNMLDVATLNGFIIMHSLGYEGTRMNFIKDVADQLAQENMQARYNDPRTYRHCKDAFTAYGFPQQRPTLQPKGMNKPRKCQTTQCRKSTRLQCSSCGKYVCGEHKKQTIHCNDCA
jgi:hypothetical protein